MTEQDWRKFHEATERAIEHMKRLIAMAEVGKKRNVTAKVTSAVNGVTRK